MAQPHKNESRQPVDSVAQPASTPPDKRSSNGGEQRRLPRLQLDAAGRLRIQTEDVRHAIRINVQDISPTGCCIRIEEVDLDGQWVPTVGASFKLELPLPEYEVALAQQGGIVWCQRSKQGHYTLGVRFENVSVDQQEALHAIFRQKMRTLLPDADAVGTEDAMIPLEIPLHVDARCPQWKGVTPGRLKLLSLNSQRMQLRHAPREGEPKRLPLHGTILDLSIFPPIWSGGELRTLWISARVLKADLEGLELAYESGENRLEDMIRALIPQEIERPAPPKEFPIAYILLALAALFAFLFISSR